MPVRAERQAHGGEVGVDALAVHRVGGRAASPEGPFKAAGGGEHADAAAAGVAREVDGKEGELAGEVRVLEGKRAADPAVARPTRRACMELARAAAKGIGHSDHRTRAAAAAYTGHTRAACRSWRPLQGARQGSTGAAASTKKRR